MASTAHETAPPLEGERKKRPGFQALAYGLFAFCLASTATSLVVSLRDREDLPQSLTGIAQASSLGVELLFVVVGLIIVAHRPENPVGWLLLVPSFVRNVENLLAYYGAKALIVDPGSLPLGAEAIWVNTWIWMPLLSVIPVLLLVYPDGRFRSPRWRWAAWASLAGGAVAAVMMGIAVWPHRGAKLFYDDHGLEELRLVVTAVVTLFVIFLIATGAGLASLVRRYRAGGEEERLQIKWLTVAVVALLVDAIFLAALPTDAQWRDALSNLAFATVPLAIGIAVLKYRLYRIDVIIDRTLVYVPLIAFIAAVTSALVPLSQRVFVALTGAESDATIVLTALFIAVLIAPVRKGLETMVEGRFKPKPVTPTPAQALLADPEFVDAVRSIARDAVKEERP